MSQPCAWSIRATATASSPVKPPSSTQSVAEMRADIGLSAGQAARTASQTSNGNRIRLASDPP